jgi:hypothetical protein
MFHDQEQFNPQGTEGQFAADFRFDFDAVDHIVGYDVYGTDLRRLGKVEQVLRPQATAQATSGGYYLLVKPGLIDSLFGVEQVHIPSAHISSVDLVDGSIYLDVPGDLLDSG